MSVLEIAESRPGTDSAVGGDGAWTTLQLVPLKFSISSAEPVPPTAQTSVAETAVTALSLPSVAGVVWMLQDVPLIVLDQRRTHVLVVDDAEAETDGPDVVAGHGADARELGDRRTRRGGRGDHGPARPVEVLGHRRHVSGARVLKADGPDVGGRDRPRPRSDRPVTVGLVTSWKLPEGGVADWTTVTVIGRPKCCRHS